MAQKNTNKTLNEQNTAKTMTSPAATFGEMTCPPTEETRRLQATAAYIRELWAAHRIPQPAFDGNPTPLPGEMMLGRRPTESEYAAVVSLLLEEDAGCDLGLFDVVANRKTVAKSMHMGIDPHELAVRIDIEHRTVTAVSEPEEGHVLVWRYAEWDSKDDWNNGAEFHTAMYSTEQADILAIGGFGGYVMYEEIAVPIGSYEHTSAQTNAGMSRRP